MDPLLLTHTDFWQDPSPIAAGIFPENLPNDRNLFNHVLFETSGSSGNPKWIALSKNALLTSATAVNQHLKISTSSCWGLALPLHHVGGFGVAARAFQGECRIEYYKNRWNPVTFTRWISDQKVTHSSLVPTQIHDLTTSGLRAPSGVTAIIVGGGRLDFKTGSAARNLGWPILASYGMTEACSQISTQSPEALLSEYKPSPMPLLPIWLAQTDDDQKLSISGPALFSGILVRQENRWIFTERKSQWFQTADHVRLQDNNLTPIGRSDLSIKILGELINLETIEQELIDISGGFLLSKDFVITPVPNARSEHVLIPVFDAEADRIMIQATLAKYKEQTRGLRRLQDAIFLIKFPRSSLGKPKRMEILGQISSE